MLTEIPKINDKVKVSDSSDYYGDWQGETLKVVGIYINHFDELNVTLRDKSGGDTDGWTLEDLNEAPSDG